MGKLGLVTIGQSPRIDMVPEIKLILGEDIDIIERGALDSLNLGQVKELHPGENDEVLVTRMADGTEVKVAHRYIFSRIKNQVKALEKKGVSVIFLACTGEFPRIESTSLIVRPQKILFNFVRALEEDLTLGILTPDELQIDSTKSRWSKIASKVFVESASPYDDIQKIKQAAERISKNNIDIAIMDCMGYTIKMKNIVKDKINKPVVLARTITARVLGELI